MFPLGVLFIFVGYAFAYTGIANLRNGGLGPTLWQSLGLSTAVAPPGADTPNLTGNTPQPGGAGGGLGGLIGGATSTGQFGGGLQTGPGGVAVAK